jgi:glycosyltransferase 2 family protein
MSTKALKLAAKASVAIAVSVLAFWWAFHDVDLAYVRANLGRISLTSIAFYVLLQLVIHAARTWRYWLLVEPLNRDPAVVDKVSLRATFAAVSVGIPAAAFFPLRLGELVRPLMLARAGAPVAAAFSTVVVERIADGLFNVGVFFALLSMLPENAPIPTDLRSVASVMLVLFGGGLIFLIAAYFMRERVLGLVEKLISRVSVNAAQKLVRLLSTFLDGLSSIGTPVRGLTFAFLTTVYWGLNGYSTYLLFDGYGLDLPVLAGNFAISCVVFTVTVPSGPAFAGTMEAGFKFGLAPYGVSPSDIATVAIVAHVLTLSMLALFAGIGFLAMEASQRRKGNATRE